MATANRIMIRSQWNKLKQGLEIGFIRADNRLVVDIEECKIAEPALNEQIKHVRAYPPPKGGLKVVLRIPPEDWVVPPDSFFQNNFFLLPKLVSVVRERLRLAGTRHLLDLYCGVGFLQPRTGRTGRVFRGVSSSISKPSKRPVATLPRVALRTGNSSPPPLKTRCRDCSPASPTSQQP